MKTPNTPRLTPKLTRQRLSATIALIMGSALLPSKSFANTNIVFEDSLTANGVTIAKLDRESEGVQGVRVGDDIRVTLDLSVEDASTVPDQQCRIAGFVGVRTFEERDSNGRAEGHRFASIEGDQAYAFEVTVREGVMSTDGPKQFALNLTDDELSEMTLDFSVRENDCDGIFNRYRDDGYGIDPSGSTYAIARSDETNPNDRPNALADLSDEQIAAVREISAQHEAVTAMALDAAKSRSRSISRELARRRNGEAGMDISGLMLNLLDTPIALSRFSSGLSANESESDSGLVSPWGGFTSGSLQLGDKDAYGDIDALDYTLNQLNIGFDYKTHAWVLGGAVMLSQGDADTNTIKKTAELDQTGVSVFGSYYISQFYIDFIASFADNDYNFTRGNALDVKGETGGKETSVALNFGYDGRISQLDYRLIGAFEAIKVDVSSYQETTTGTSDVFYIDDFDRKLQTVSFGSQVSYTINSSSGVFIPFAGLSYQVNLQDESWGAQLTVDSTTVDIINADSLDDHASAELGVSAVFPRGFSAYVTTQFSLGSQTWAYNSYDIGLRWEF